MAGVIIDCATYRQGHREETSHDPAALADVIADLTGTEGFLWVGLYEPSVEEMTRFAEPLKLHPLAVEDAVQAHQRPKVDRYDDHLFMSVKTVTYTNDNIETAEINAFLGQNYLITVRHGEGHDLREVRRRAESNEQELEHGAIAGIYGMNFDHMPELTWTFGYPLVLGLIGGLCAYVYARFKKSGWL